MFEPKNILVPSDFTGFSDMAIKQALEIASQFKAKINVLHVVEPVSPCAADYCPDPVVLLKAEDDMIHTASDMLHAELAKFHDFNDIKVMYDVREGDPGDEILREQEEKDIDLIVMSPHGKSGLLKRVIGTVSEKVTEEAKCPVLLVRS